MYLIVLYCITYEKSYDALGLLTNLGSSCKKMHTQTHTPQSELWFLKSLNMRTIKLSLAMFFSYISPFWKVGSSLKQNFHLSNTELKNFPFSVWVHFFFSEYFQQMNKHCSNSKLCFSDFFSQTDFTECCV